MLYHFIVRLRSSILVFLTHHLALPFLQLVRNEEKFPYTMAELNAMPPASLGYQLANFLEQKHLQLLPYYARHDIKHILLNYDTTDKGEVCLQCFMLGNGHLSFPVAATVLYGFVTMPEHWTAFRKAFTRGKQHLPISNWKWFDLLQDTTASVRQKIDINA